ncbi:hypothetical protein [Epibacterium ulvae]|uniref:hypothetical protein n=1 Tax=Epibacterium ulvae TaxID=1156985 RepID=UPI002491E21F|nr:hypothetical protein [Epibacterium ulvae]
MSLEIPDPSAAGGGADELSRLRSELADIKDRLDAGDVAAQDEQRRLLIAEIRQRMQFRQMVLVICAVVLVVMALFAFSGMCYALPEVRWFGSVASFLTVSSSYAIALFIAPIASITMITVSLMIGTFRRYSDKGTEGLAGAAFEAGKAASGQV